MTGHFPPPPEGPLAPHPTRQDSRGLEFLALGEGAALWLTEALTSAPPRAPGQAATAARFAEGDLAAILTHQSQAASGGTQRAGEHNSLAQGTTSWANLGRDQGGVN